MGRKKRVFFIDTSHNEKQSAGFERTDHVAAHKGKLSGKSVEAKKSQN